MSSTTRIRALAAFIAVTTGALLVVAGPAQAATSARTDTDDDVCWLNADTDEFQCFTDEVAFEQAVFEQTGAVLVESEEAPAARSALGILTIYTAVRFWDGGSYTGSSTAITTSNSAVCTSGSGIVGNVMPVGWNDRASSFQTFLSCVTKVYEDINLGGGSYGYATNAPSLAGLNNEASSFRLI